MRYRLLIVALVAVFGLLAWEFIPIREKVWVGGYELTVHVTSPLSESGLVMCQAFGRQEYAHEACELWLSHSVRLANPTHQANLREPFKGEPLRVAVPTGGRESTFRRQISRYSFKYLVVAAQFKNGERAAKIVEIPEPGIATEITVSLP